MLIFFLFILCSLPSSGQDLRPYRVGLLFFKQEKFTDAAERWLAEAERTRSSASNQVDVRAAGYGYVLASVAYDLADDDRAYASWAEAIRVLLEGESRWDLERDRLVARLQDLNSLLSSLDAAEPGAISEEILLLIELEESVGLSSFQGPRIGLSAPTTRISELGQTETRQYFAKPLALSDSENRSRYRDSSSATISDDDAERRSTQAPSEPIEAEDRLPTRVIPSLSSDEGAGSRGTRPTPISPQDEPARVDPQTPALRGSGFVPLEESGPDEPLPDESEPRAAAPSAVEQAVARAAQRVGGEPSGDSGDPRRSRITPPEDSEPLVEPEPELVVFGPQVEVAVLSEEDLATARHAWRFFQENLQVSSGFVNAVNKYSTLSMWEMGSCIGGIVAAHQLGLVPKIRFDSMLDRTLSSLGRIPIYRDELPNLEYNATTGQMIDTRHRESDRGSGFSALDTGRLLVWLRIVKEWYPERAPAVDQIVERFDFERVLADRELHSVQLDRSQESLEQQGRLGYEQYAATGFALWGGSVSRAMDLDDVDYREIFGVSVPYDRRAGSFLTSEPFILAGLELGGVSPDFSRLVKSVFEVQQRRWEEDAVLTAMSEDSLNQPPWFVYGSIVHGESTWDAFDAGGAAHRQYRGLSTKAAFGWHALFQNDFTVRLVEVAAQLVHARYGFFAGLFENGEVNEALSLNTNAVVLESLLYRQRGGRPFLQIDFEPGETRGYRRR